MKITFIPDELGWQRIPDAVGYLRQYREKGNNKSGRNNAVLEIQQHSGYEWVFEIWHTKVGYNVQITTKPYTKKSEEERELGNL